MLSTAKAEATVRDLAESLEKRGFAVVETSVTGGRKLSLDSDQITIQITAQDATGVDIFGQANQDFTPHKVLFAIDNATATHTKAAKAFMSLGKYGFDVQIGEGANIGAAEAAADAAAAERNSVQWPKRGA